MENAGVKHDGEKVRMDLLNVSMPNAVLEVAKVLTFGAKKYDDDNWKKVPDARRRYSAALDRHMNALHRGEKVDPETGLSHLAHAACCVLFMLEMEI
jgi:hypothetical protein